MWEKNTSAGLSIERLKRARRGPEGCIRAWISWTSPGFLRLSVIEENARHPPKEVHQAGIQFYEGNGYWTEKDRLVSKSNVN
ncbi:hypothetical protein TNCV_285501 [Trichonephila clavipes]|nr:hypothetical protein TNCV_285501 [Trichonephila clavipes]